MAWRTCTRAACALWLCMVGAACGEDDEPGAPTAASETPGVGGQGGGLAPPVLDTGEWRGLTAQGTSIGFEISDNAVARLDLVWRLGKCEMRQSFRFEEPLPIRDSSLTAELVTEPGDSRATFEVAFAGGDRALGLLKWTTSAVPDQPGCSGLGEAVFTAAPVAKGGEAAP